LLSVHRNNVIADAVKIDVLVASLLHRLLHIEMRWW